jgi:hypothetical protein
MDMSQPVPWTDSGAKPTVQRDAQNKITAIVLNIPAAAVTGAPKKRSEAVLPMTDAGLVQSANLQYHPYGHEPAHVYDTPHFDVHFYTITEEVRHGVMPGTPGAKVMPAKTILPPGGFLSTEVVPGMGMHDVPMTQPELQRGKGHGPFTVSPIIGYWNGELAFFEVMFTKAWALQKTDKAGAFPQPASVHQQGLYPTKYSVHYDKAQDEYEVTLSGFRQR